MRVWLIRIAWNLAVDRRRRIRPEQFDEGFADSLVGRGLPADEALDEAQRMRSVLRELERLPKAERNVLLLAAIEELGTAEMAEVLGRSESAVRALLFRARARLRERLEECEGEAMKNSEEAIERVLGGLRDADAPAGMERRILEALDDRGDDRAAARTRSGWRWLRPIWRVAPARPFAVGSVESLVCGVALASLFVAALVIPSIRRFGLAPARSKMNPAGAGAAAESVRLTTSAMAANVAQLHPAESGGRPMRRTSEGEMTNATATVDYARDRDGHDRVSDSDTDSDAVALEEMRAASHPAPPLPLTEQERLLLRIAHRGDPVELAMLDPMTRAARDVEEGAEFQRFFGSAIVRQPSTGQLSTEQPSTEQPATEQPKTEQPKNEQPAMDAPTTEQSRTGDKE